MQGYRRIKVALSEAAHATVRDPIISGVAPPVWSGTVNYRNIAVGEEGAKCLFVGSRTQIMQHCKEPNSVLLSIFDMAHLPHAKSRCVLLKIYNEHAIADLLLKGIFEAENDSFASGAFLENIE